MAHVIPIAAAIAMLSAPAWSQSTPIAPVSAPEAHQHGRSLNFDMPDGATDPSFVAISGSRVVAGTELAPNTLVGIGMFGLKSEKSPHAAATARDLAVTRSRKAAVGLSLKF